MKFKKEDRIKVHQKCNGKCGYCGIDINLKDMQIDHIIPKSNYIDYIQKQKYISDFLTHLTVYDIDSFDNLMPTCRTCNKWKSAHHLELFRSELSEQINRLNNYNANYRIAKKYGLIQEIEKNIIFYFEKMNINRIFVSK